MSNEIKEKEEYEKYARGHLKELDSQEVKLGDVVTVLVGHFAGEKGVIVGMSACHNDYTDPHYEVDMNCEVPEKYKCRKTLMTPNNVIGGLSAHEFEVIGNHTPKQPSMEIKQGDKVRVSKDAPELYTMYGQTDWESVESTVEKIDGDAAEIRWFNENSDEYDYITIPTKYLVKVSGEYKPKFKKGDKVRFKKVYTVVSVDDGQVLINSAGNHIDEDCLELYAEPTEQTEKKPYEEGISEETANEISDMLEAYTKALSGIADSFDWQRYEADLAKEVALKVANKYNDPKQAAEYAVSVAKSVVEGLKRK